MSGVSGAWQLGTGKGLGGAAGWPDGGLRAIRQLLETALEYTPKREGALGLLPWPGTPRL